MASPSPALPTALSKPVAYRILLLVTFIESAATALIERGIFFYTEDKLGFTNEQNLLLALTFALPYVIGAFGAHTLTQRWFSERALTLLAIVGQAAFLLIIAIHPAAWTIFVAQAVMGGCTGLKWPPIESYISAGLTPSQSSKRIGVFNVTWAGAVPLAIIAAGPMIAWWDGAFFVLPPVLSVLSFILMLRQPANPTHLPDDHPERPTPEHLVRMKALLVSSRWLLMGSYATYFVLAALMPGVFKRLDFDVGEATMLSAIIEVVRVVTFFFMHRFVGWHFKAWPLVASMLLVPAGFILIVSADSLPLVLAGEVLYGGAMGLTYYCALYYAIVVKNAAVDAGGVHEGLIGIGFVIGPVAAALPAMVSWNIYFGMAPLIGVTIIASARPLSRLLRPHDTS